MLRAMNDPHVNALVFKVEHRSTVAYGDDAPPIEHQEPGFLVRLADGTVRFEFQEHHATKDEALERVRPYIENWEMDASLRGQPGDFRLRFQETEVIDQDPPPPTPGAARGFAQGIVAVGTLGQASGMAVKPYYPAPPSGLTLNVDAPDVGTMYRRLSGYYEGHEPLQGMAYFCLTVVEQRFSGPRKAAKSLGIAAKVLGEISRLANKGGEDSARKAGVVGTPLSSEEKRFLEEGVKAIIRRVAEVAHDPGGSFPTITRADLHHRS